VGGTGSEQRHSRWHGVCHGSGVDCKLATRQGRTVIQMIMKQRQNRIISPFFGLWLALLLIPHRGAAADETFALVETKTGVYSNVTVTTKSADYIVIKHSMGLASLKVTELSPEVREELGYVAAKSKLDLGSMTVTAKARSLMEAIPAIKIEEAWNDYAPAGTPSLKLDAKIIGVVLGAMVISYLFFCFCGALICQKAGHPAGILMWIPILQFVPLLRAAKMSPLWLLAMLIPLLNIWAHILWSFRIAGARGKGWGTALLLILPTYPLAFIYLAFAGTGDPLASKEVPPTPEQLRASSMVLDQG
jgi:hypothetical protein